MRGSAATALAAALALAACETSSGAAPAQPIPFSHRVHAGVNRIGCTFCHAYAANGPVAGVPAMATCDGCHKFVDVDKPDVKQVEETFAAGRVIAWIRVYELPDHVYFTHERHVRAGVACAACHGRVEEMDVLGRAQPLTMGFCLTCHQSRDAPRDCQTCHK